jgi:hypothetical protein
MTANGDKRLDRLFAAARGTAPDTSGVEEGFEARVAARVREARGGEEEALFLAPLFAAVALTVGVWTAATGPVQGFGTGAEVAAAWEAAELADSLGGGS